MPPHGKSFQHTAARRRLLTACGRIGETKCFNTQPPEGGWSWCFCRSSCCACFNTQPPEGGCSSTGSYCLCSRFQHTAARRRLMAMGLASRQQPVSTHSRPKAAVGGLARFWLSRPFQHTAARRRLVREAGQPVSGSPFQHTAARRRLAAEPEVLAKGRASFNTQPPEGGCHLLYWIFATSFVSTHSRPKAAGHRDRAGGSVGSFNTQPPEGGCGGRCRQTRRARVSTHSRPKAAAGSGLLACLGG